MWWFHGEFVGRDEILNSLEKPPSLPLSPAQIGIVVAFAREHYQRIGYVVVHKLTEKNIGHSTLVSTHLNQLRTCPFKN